MRVSAVLDCKRRERNLVVSPFVVCKSRWVSVDIVCGAEKANMREALNELQKFAFGLLLDSACLSQYMIWILEMASVFILCSN